MYTVNMNRPNKKIHEACSSAIAVRDNKFVLLYDHRKKHYVTPQGHKRKKETLSETALREVREETGFQNLSIIRKLGKYQYHFYQNKKTIYKIIHVYLVRVNNGKKLKNTQNVNENFTTHLFSSKKTIEVVRWKQDKKFISLAQKFLKI